MKHTTETHVQTINNNTFMNHQIMCFIHFLFQLIADVLLFFCTYGIGLWIRISAEISQRKAFLETRQCIETRLNLQKHNLQQVCTHSVNYMLLVRVLVSHIWWSVIYMFENCGIQNFSIARIKYEKKTLTKTIYVRLV